MLENAHFTGGLVACHATGLWLRELGLDWRVSCKAPYLFDSDPRLQHHFPSISEGLCLLSAFCTPQSYRNPYQFGETEDATTCGIFRQPAM